MKLAGMMAFLILLFIITLPVYGGQVCEAVLAKSLETKVSKVGDHILLRTTLFTGPAESPITTLDGSISEVHPSVNGSSFIVRIRVNKGVRSDGHEAPVEARIVAVILQTRVKEWWDLPLITADRFPHISGDNEREPGERKLSEYEPHNSPLDSHFASSSTTRAINSGVTPALAISGVTCTSSSSGMSSHNPTSDLRNAFPPYSGVLGRASLRVITSHDTLGIYSHLSSI